MGKNPACHTEQVLVVTVLRIHFSFLDKDDQLLSLPGCLMLVKTTCNLQNMAESLILSRFALVLHAPTTFSLFDLTLASLTSSWQGRVVSLIRSVSTTCTS